MASWTYNGNVLDLLNSGDNDIISIMDLFARISAASARFYFLHGLEPRETTQHVRTRLRTVNAIIMERIPIVEKAYSEEDKEEAEFQDWLDDHREARRQMQGAEIARDKLDVTTRQGRIRLTRGHGRTSLRCGRPILRVCCPRSPRESSITCTKTIHGIAHRKNLC